MHNIKPKPNPQANSLKNNFHVKTNRPKPMEIKNNVQKRNGIRKINIKAIIANAFLSDLIVN